jgi:hypothetical protein
MQVVHALGNTILPSPTPGHTASIAPRGSGSEARSSLLRSAGIPGLSGGWDLPFDSLWSSGPKALTRGWSLYPISSVRSGFPLDVNASVQAAPDKPDPSGAGDADVVPPNLATSTIQTFDPRQTRTINGVTGNYWFDPNAFTLPDHFNDPVTYLLPASAPTAPCRGMRFAARAGPISTSR